MIAKCGLLIAKRKNLEMHHYLRVGPIVQSYYSYYLLVTYGGQHIF